MLHSPSFLQNLQSSCGCPSNTGISGTYHHAQLASVYFNNFTITYPGNNLHFAVFTLSGVSQGSGISMVPFCTNSRKFLVIYPNVCPALFSPLLIHQSQMSHCMICASFVSSTLLSLSFRMPKLEDFQIPSSLAMFNTMSSTVGSFDFGHSNISVLNFHPVLLKFAFGSLDSLFDHEHYIFL